MRNIQLIEDEHYHIYNRGVDKRNIFLKKNDYERFLRTLVDLQKHGSISEADYQQVGARICAYCLNPNHFHLILRQMRADGISDFMHKLSTSYTRYFNLKNQRSGSLFQGTFKAAHINSDEYLLWVATYVNANAEIHGLVDDGREYQWCSYGEYLYPSAHSICETSIVLGQFINPESYSELARKQIIEMKKNKRLSGVWHED